MLSTMAARTTAVVHIRAAVHALITVVGITRTRTVVTTRDKQTHTIRVAITRIQNLATGTDSINPECQPSVTYFSGSTCCRVRSRELTPAKVLDEYRRDAVKKLEQYRQSKAVDETRQSISSDRIN
jgi:hypothetical protein